MTMINEYLTVITRCGYCTCQLLAKSTLIRIKLIHGQYTVRLRLIYTISVNESKDIPWRNKHFLPEDQGLFNNRTLQTVNRIIFYLVFVAKTVSVLYNKVYYYEKKILI